MKSFTFSLFIAVICIFAGYLIAVISDSAQEAYQDFKEIESIVSDVGGVKNIEELKAKVKSNPKLLEKFNPSMMKNFESNPMFKKQLESNPEIRKQIESKMKELY